MSSDPKETDEKRAEPNPPSAMAVFEIACWIVVAVALAVATFLWVPQASN